MNQSPEEHLDVSSRKPAPPGQGAKHRCIGIQVIVVPMSDRSSANDSICGLTWGGSQGNQSTKIVHSCKRAVHALWRPNIAACPFPIWPVRRHLDPGSSRNTDIAHHETAQNAASTKRNCQLCGTSERVDRSRMSVPRRHMRDRIGSSCFRPRSRRTRGVPPFHGP